MATEVARRMVCEWGMSEKLGPIAFGKREELVFLGHEISQSKDYSESTAQLIDEEVRRLVEDAEERAKTLLSENIDRLHMLANTLLEREIMDGDEITRLLNGETLDPLPARGNGRLDDPEDAGEQDEPDEEEAQPSESAATAEASESAESDDATAGDGDEPGGGDESSAAARTAEGMDGQGEEADQPSRARSSDGT
jgi:cell division protease FtsH